MSNPFDQFDASPDAGNPFDRFDAAKPTKKPGILADVGDAFVGGAKAAGQAIAATGNVYTGDEKALVEKAATQKKDQESKPEALKRFNEAVQTRAAPLGNDPGLWDSIKAVGGAVVEQPKGAGLAIIEQLPNAAPAMAGGLAGMKAGSMAGTAVAPGAGTAVGGILGGVAGMFLGNTAIETGHKAIEAAQDGSVTPQEMANVRKEGAVKAGVITGVDALTLGASKAITNAGARAVESATRKTLTDAGVNIADKAAVLAARQSPEISSAVRAAQETALASANTLGKRAAAGGAALGLETVGEGVGEYFGELAATGKANMVDAVLESVLSLGQSGAEVAWGVARNKKSEGAGLWDIAGGKYAETKSAEIAGLLPAPTYTGTPGDQIIANDAERQAAIDAADKNAAELYAAREEFEQKLRQRVTITNEPAPLQQRIDDMLNVDTSKLTGIERTNYEKALAAAFNEPIGIRHDKDQREVPFTIGEYLDAQVALEDAVRNREKSGRAVAESGARLQQLAEEEATQQPDIPAPSRGIMPAIPVVGPLSKVANIAVQSGAAQQVQQQAGAGILAPTVGGSRPVPAAEASTSPLAAAATQAAAPSAQTAIAPSQGEASQQPAAPLPESGAPGAAITQQAQPVVPAATEQAKPEIVASDSKNAQPDKNSAGTATQSAENSADEAYRPLIESLIKNKRNAKQLGFDIEGAIQKAKDAMHGKKQMPGAFRNLANKAEKLGDKETALILRQIADMNDARKAPKKVEADQRPANKEAPATAGSAAEKATTDRAKIEADFAENREAMKDFKVGDDVSYVARGTYTQKDGSKLVDPIRAGKITAVQDKRQGTFLVDGNVTIGARHLTKKSPAEGKGTAHGSQFANGEQVADSAATAAPKRNEVAKARKGFERELSVFSTANDALIALAAGNTQQEFTAAAEEAIVAEVGRMKKDATPAQAAALAELVADGKPVLPAKFYEAAFKQAKAIADERAKEAARDPAVYQETLDWGMGAKSIEKGSPQAAAYKVGFDHALKGKTKSTLPQDDPTYVTGYNDARAWIKTDEGRAWYEGKGRGEKLQSTGERLRRQQDRLRKDLSNLSTADMKKAFERLKSSASRAEWFPILLADDATPGAKAWLEDFRSKVSTFTEYFMYRAIKSTVSRGRYSATPERVFTGAYTHYEGEFDRDLDDAGRVELGKTIAIDYQEKVKALAELFSGTKTLADIEKVVRKHFDGAWENSEESPRVYESAAYKADPALYAQNNSDIKSILPTSYQYSRWQNALKAEATERKESDRATPLTRPRLDRVLRKGFPDSRAGRDVTPAEFKKTFGFADVTIGDYVTSQEGQDHLNYAYDAFMSLAHMLGAKPSQLAFGGKLHFSIGALGHGKYAAHFSPNHPTESGGSVPVINVTKTRGDGSVLHEYFHAIDGMTTDPKLRSAIASIKQMLRINAPAPDQALEIARKFLVGGWSYKNMGRNSGPLDNAEYALKSGYAGTRAGRATDFIKEAELLDAGKKGDERYWSNDKEPFARAAESWGYDRMLAEQNRDDYLQSDWSADGKVKRPGYRGAPYPMGEERKALNALMQQLVDNMEWTDHGPVLKADSAWQTQMPFEAAWAPFHAARKEAIAKLPELQTEFKEEAAKKKAEAEAKYEAEKSAAIFGEKQQDEPSATPADDPDVAEAVADVADNASLSDAELSQLWDDVAASQEEAQQETPVKDTKPAGEAVVADKTRWTQEDLKYILDRIEEGQMILVADNGELGIPTIHDMPSDKSTHMGMGVFKTSADSWEANWTAGGAMSHTPGGIGYTTINMTRGDRPDFYDADAIKQKIRAKLLPKAGPRAAPKLEDEQAKTAGELAAEMAKHGVKGIDEALKGLVALFGGGKGKLMSFPAGMDKETYEAAKPHFKAAADAFAQAGRSFKEFVSLFFGAIRKQFGDGVKPYAIQFIKDYEEDFRANQAAEPAATDEAKPTLGNTSSAKVAEWVRQKLDDGEAFGWRELFEKADFYFGGTQANGIYTVKDAYDAMELGINKYLLDFGDRLSPATDAAQARKRIETAKELLDQVATQTKRTAEQDEFQQFSTPPHFSYLANWSANLRTDDVYLEPSAGIGGLAVFGRLAGVKEIIVNELSPRRREVLRNMPFDRFFAENGEQLNNVLPDSVRPTVIVMNPPFSATAGRMEGKRDTMNGAKHLEQALKRLAPGGRLVAITGEGMGADKPAFRDWWKKIMAEYNVRANIGIDGSSYAKYGTTFDNQLIVIDKSGPTTAAVVTGKVSSPAEAIGKLEDVRNDRPVAAQDSEGTGVAGKSASVEAGGTTADNGRGGPSASGDAGGTGAPAMGGRGRGAGVQSGRKPGGSGVSTGDDAVARKGAEGGDATGSQSGRPGNRGAAGDQGREDTRASGQGGAVSSGVTVESSGGEATGAIGNSVFEQYEPKKVRIPGAVPHNTPLVESAALASVVPPDPTYTPNLPEKLVKDGLLSSAQLESVVYAGQAHQQMLPDAETRRGFFLGDGTGVGKGRQISGIIMDNWRQGRKKAVWISKKKELMADAVRDFSDIGGDPKLIFSHAKLKASAPISHKEGILFSAYPTLRSESKEAKLGKKKNNGVALDKDGKKKDIQYERIQQMVDWLGADFDGVVVFDEAHEMGNAVAIKGKRGNTDPSQQALAALELQRALPKARIVYVSATGATEVSNLAYAERLGLWGDGTPFAAVQSFIAEMGRSVSSMELVAQNLKQMGLYLARSLSFDGVKYEKVEHQLTDYQRDTYDLLAGAWQNVLQNIDAALKETGVYDDNGKAAGGKDSGKRKGAILSAFWGSHQRFFNQIITAAQMPTVLTQIDEDLAAGKSVVIQLTNTNEADQARALAKLAGQKIQKQEDSDADEDTIEELDMTPREQLISFIEKAFPVEQFETYTDDDGNSRIRPVVDSEGKPVINKDALARKDELIRAIRAISIPDSALQMLINHFGPEQVAEITGRTQRIIPGENGKFKVEKRGSSAVEHDAQAFKDGKKHILVFSQAGGTGFSFQSDLRYKNQQQRVHYVLQPGWSADKAVQGFGRTHRTNQKSAPIYKLTTTDIPAQKRFISSIARRLEQLGALTTGQRDTVGGSMFSASDNLESKYATAAVRQLFENYLRPGVDTGLPADLLEQMGLTGIKDENTGGLNETKVPATTQFLNRMLSLRLDSQLAVFDAFAKSLEMQIDIAKRTGQFDDGLQTVKHEGATVLSEQEVYRDPATNAATRYVEIEYQVKNPKYGFDTPNTTIKNAKQGAAWFKNKHSGRVAAIWMTGQTHTTKEGRIEKVYGYWRTSGSSYEPQSAFKVDAWERLENVDDARKLWEAETNDRPDTMPKKLHMVVGGILPIWNRFNNEHIHVSRIGTDDGRRFLGRTIREKDLQTTLQKLDVQSSAAKMDGAALFKAAMAGDFVTMTNGATLERVTVSGDSRVEIKNLGRYGIDSATAKKLREAGAIYERIDWKERWFAPNGKVIDELMRSLAMNALSVGRQDDINEGLGNIAARNEKVSPADTAIYGMAAEGKSSSEILKFIASASRSPFNRQLAKLLLKTGIAPKITVGDGKGWKMNAGEGHKYAAAYNPQTDTVALFRPGSAERNMLHELMHAATIKALGKNGLAAGQMKALFAHVQKVGKAYGLHYDKNTKRGTYGMADIDEFVAEAFTNPKFQEALKKVTAPKANGRISSAWQWFVRIVRGILGLPTNDESALSAALDIGLGVMREDMAIRKAGALPRSIMVDGAWRPTSNANGTQIHYTAEGVRNFWRWMDATDRQRLAGQAGQGDNQRGFHQPAERNPVVAKYFFDGRGHPRVFFHGTADSVSNFDFDHQNRLDHGWLGRGVYLSGDPELANSYANIKRGSAGPNVMPLYVALHNPLEATLEVKNAFRKRDKAWVDAWTKRAMAAGHDGVVLDLGNDFLEVVAFNPSAVKSATGNNGQFDPANLDIRYNVAEYFRSMGIKAGASDSEIEAIRADVQFVAGRDEKTGFPTWKGKHVSLSSPRDVTESHDVFYRPTGSERAVKYDIRSANGQIVGHTVLEIDQDWPTQLLDIAIQDQHKGKRYAEKAVAGIVADAGEIGIWHIIPSARSWWERVGTQTVDAHNGTLAFNDYADARASRENAGSLGEDVGIRYNVQNAASTAAAKLRVDVPNEAWLQEQIDYAKSKGSNRYGVPYMGKQTARFNGAVRIPVSVLSKLKGQRGEQGNVRADDLAAIKRVMQETGKLPLTERGTEYLPYIEVAHDGSAWISEGNHRIMAAAELGWHDLPVEIRYFDGGERKNGALNPDRLVSGQGDAIRYNITDDGAWEVSEPSKMDDVIYALQDKHIDTKRVMQAIAGAGKKIRDAFNPYLQEELFHGRAAKGVKDFLDFELRPLLKEMQTLGVDMGDFEEYLWNRHAEERNRQIAKVNPDMKDGGSGIKTADARAYLSGLSAEQRQNFEALAAHIDNINAGSRKILVDSGLEKAETIAAWEGAYKHYVPLQREDVDSGYIGTGKGFSVRGSSTKRAMGSGRPVIDIIANLTMQRERNIVRAEKNRVSQAVMGLAVTNPNPDFWTVDKAPKERVVQETTIYSVLDEAGNKVSEFTRMDDADKAAKAIPNSTIEQTWEDRVTERVTPGFLQRDNVLLTRINGQDHYVIFNEREPRAVRMAQAMKNLDADNLGAALSVIGRATRYLASVNTQYNPVFGVINLIRDTQGAMLNLASTPLAGEQKRVLGYTVDALRGIYADIRAHRAGRSPSSNWAQLFEEFQKEGGQTGYRDQYAGAEQRAEAIKSELAQFTEGAPKRLLRGVFGWLSDYNETMENAVRLAAYKAATEKGMSKQQAASLAKNITVNFNRKGQMATQVGALYAFFNASVQGTARIAETLFEKNEGNIKKAKLSKTGKKILAGGIMLGSMQALLLAAAGFDDDEPPEFVRERNLVMPIGDGKYLTLAMPLGFHVLPGIGRIATEFAMSGFKDPAKRTMQFASMLAEAFNPVGNAGFSLQTITPSVVDPFAALAENKDFTGKEIYRENFNAMNPTPGHTRAKDVATVWSRAISEALNFITGGSEFKPGVMSWSPDAIDYLIGQATGGVGREVSKAYQTGAAATTGEDLPLYKVPLVGRFVGDTEGQSGQSAKFYEAIKQINMHEAEYKGLMKSGRGAEAREYMQDNPETRLIMAGNHAETQVRKLRSMKRDLIEKGAEKEKVREIDARISDAMRRFNDRYAAASV